MSTSEIKARLHELLCAGFSERGFAYAQLPRKDPNRNRFSPFTKRTPEHLPPGAWTITVDILTVGGGKCILPYVFCTIQLEAVQALLAGSEHTYYFAPGDATGGEAGILQIDRGEGPEACAEAIFQIVDAIAVPQFERYSVLDNLIEALTPDEEPADGAASHDRRNPMPGEIMAAIAAAYLLGRLDQCETIARKGKIAYLRSSSDFGSKMREDLDISLSNFHQRFLKPRGVKSEIWKRSL